ncbi:hypothetical protein I4641_10410 [Waterburya agarophytonicola K14]|uniref:Outer membrane lipoprotein-sorting protein n=1 Tax=Waterburya agarophytonicola KI4 TaxID=2874699 RepID=A0A964FHD1_9CYAN|nr:hypothetical protein [Waterburya agarophytonicola]MCC0177388.1 hypothetical protein [Waterburya agarophytonicola KI4]
MKSLLLLGFTVFSLGNLAQIKAIAQSTLDTPAPQTEASPLVQSAKAFISLESYELESVMETTGDIPGTAFTSNAKIKTIVAAPNKFNSQITFVSPNGLEGKTYRVVSNGSQVWIYNWATNQYSVSDIKQFLQTREGFLIGTLSYFYINTRSNIGGWRIMGNFLAKLPEAQLLKYFQKFTNLDLQNLTIRDEKLNGKTYKAYDIDAKNQGFQATAYIDTQKGNLERVHLSGAKNGLQLTSKEQVINQTIPESIPPQTFVFSAADDAEQVEQQIPIAPF